MKETDDLETEIERVDRFIDKVESIINADDKVTEEEEKLFDNILEHLSHYRIMLMDITDDEVIDEEERKEMDEFRKEVMGQAKLIAFEDEKFSDDEIKVLKELKKFAEDTKY